MKHITVMSCNGSRPPSRQYGRRRVSAHQPMPRTRVWAEREIGGRDASRFRAFSVGDCISRYLSSITRVIVATFSCRPPPRLRIKRGCRCQPLIFSLILPGIARWRLWRGRWHRLFAASGYHRPRAPASSSPRSHLNKHVAAHGR